MPKQVVGLTAAKVRAAKPGTYVDGAGLMLVVSVAENAKWSLRYSFAGRRRDLGLGAARGPSAVSLAEARQKAAEARALIRLGSDPVEARKATVAAIKAVAEKSALTTFKEAADAYIEANEAGWRNAKHRAQWKMTLTKIAGPKLGVLPVSDITTQHVLSALQPIWEKIPETATRTRGRIEAVLDYAKVRGWRDGENPARWKGHLALALPRRSQVAQVEHHAALPWQELPGFMTELRALNAVSARALELVILGAARSGEVLGATWGEIDLDKALWVIPAKRMKAKREHRVALSSAAAALLRSMLPVRMSDDPQMMVFPGQKESRPLSIMAMAMTLRRMGRVDLTVHGFRSTFRDWAGETTPHPREVVEAALAHRSGDKVEQAYARGDLFTKRKRLMEDWAAFCTKTVGDNIAQLHGEATAAATA